MSSVTSTHDSASDRMAAAGSPVRKVRVPVCPGAPTRPRLHAYREAMYEVQRRKEDGRLSSYGVFATYIEAANASRDMNELARHLGRAQLYEVCERN